MKELSETGRCLFEACAALGDTAIDGLQIVTIVMLGLWKVEPK